MRRPYKALFSLSLAFSFIGNAATGQQNQQNEITIETRVILRGLDKITARIQLLELPIGVDGHFGSLIITPRYCRTRPPAEPPETFAFLEIIDEKRGGELEKVFSGWMIASSPGWNALEHPVYDIWVIGCKEVDVKTPVIAPNTPNKASSDSEN